MKAIEVTGKIDAQGNLILDRPLQGTTYPERVRVIVLFGQTESGGNDSEDTPIEEVKASLRRALQQAKVGRTRPIAELWDRIDAR